MKTVCDFFRRWKKTILAGGLVVVLFALCISVPGWLFQGLDRQLLQGVHPRQRIAGRLASEAEDIYLVRALHQRLQLQQKGTFLQQETVSQRVPVAQVQESFATLAEAQFVPKDAMLILEEWLEKEETYATKITDGTGVALVHCQFGEEGTFTLSYEIEEVTGVVVRCWTTGTLPKELDKITDAPAPLESYLAYAGLTSISDWEEAFSYYKMGAKSEDGQLMAYYENYFTFGVVPL